MTAEEAIIASIDLPGKRVLDVGCGEGDITRALLATGAQVVSIDPNPAQIRFILDNNPGTGESYVQAPGQALPFADMCFDAVIYNNSLHLLPDDLQPQALAEAVRVLKPGGFLYIANPLAEGPSHELKLAIGDDIYILPSPMKAIVTVKQTSCYEEKEFIYAKMIVHESFDAYRDRAIRRGPYRKKLFDKHEQKTRDLFAAICPKIKGGYAVSQFILVNLLVKK